MSRTIRTINQTKHIEDIRKGEERFYSEYHTTVVIINNKPTHVKAIEWRDRRTVEQKVNHTPFFYYVAISERYESDMYEKYFQDKEKAEAYARQLADEWLDGNFEDDYECVYTCIIPFDD